MRGMAKRRKITDLGRREFYAVAGGKIVGGLMNYYEATDYLKQHHRVEWLTCKAKVRHVTQRYTAKEGSKSELR